MASPKLLVVQHQEAIASQLRWALRDEYEVSVASTSKGAVDLVDRFRPDLVTLDLGIPPGPEGTEEGLRVLKELLRRDRRLKVIVTTGSDERQAALGAVHLGAYDYQQRPVDLDQLRIVLRRAAYVQHLERENDARTEATVSAHAYGRLLGSSDPMRNLFCQIDRIAPSNTTVLIQGDGGTGKELVAQAVHERSRRRAGPFIAIHCATIPHDLGKIEFADGGTVFLDDIGELDLALQAKLLRFLQDHTVDRIGGRASIAVDGRVIAAGNADLQQLIAGGRFREDLYHRLSVVSLLVPPLRERGEDVVLLANAFLRRFAREAGGRAPRGFTPEALGAMKAYAWPGNVRELESKVRRTVRVAGGPLVTAANLGLEPQAGVVLSLRGARESVERQLVVDALTRTSGNISQAARAIGVTRPTLHSLLAKYRIPAQPFRGR